MIIFNLDHGKYRYHYHTPSQHSTSVRDERIVTYTNLYMIRTQPSQFGDSCLNVWINLNSIWTSISQRFFFLSKRAIRSWQIALSEIALSWPQRIKAQQIASTHITSYLTLEMYRVSPRIVESFKDHLRLASRRVRSTMWFYDFLVLKKYLSNTCECFTLI